MVNGYVTLDLASNKIYNESLNAIKSGKPVMVVDAPNVYFADTIKVATIDDDKVVVITKGGKTITIANDNTITSSGDVQNHLYKCFISSAYLQTQSADYRGTYIIDIKEIPTNISSNTFNDIKTYLSNLLDKCGIINIVPSDGDSTFRGTIYKVNNKIYIEGYLDEDGYIKVDFDTLESDTDLDLTLYWKSIQIF